jgi:hypothetical protein
MGFLSRIDSGLRRTIVPLTLIGAVTLAELKTSGVVFGASTAARPKIRPKTTPEVFSSAPART